MAFRNVACPPLLVAAIWLGTPPALADSLSGQASVIDGDTLVINGTHIRLWGIDAPEINQSCRGDDSMQYPCGTKAAHRLESFLNGRPIDCAPISLDQYGQTFAACSVDGIDLADWLVRNGLALDWPEYPAASLTKRSGMRSMRGAEYGKAAMSSRGCSALASSRAASALTARTMRTCTPDGH